jgi:hypothetical protein
MRAASASRPWSRATFAALALAQVAQAALGRLQPFRQLAFGLAEAGIGVAPDVVDHREGTQGFAA